LLIFTQVLRERQRAALPKYRVLKIAVPDAHLLHFKKNNIRQALRKSGQLIVKEARALTRSDSGGGRAYSTPSSISKGIHYASAPGEPPARLSGQLTGSIGMKVQRGGERIQIYDGTFYSRFLEVGAQGGAGTNQKGGRGRKNSRAGNSRKNPKISNSSIRVLEPRPFISRAAEDHEAEIREKIAAAVAKDIEFGKA
jgi:hypothetical protein